MQYIQLFNHIHCLSCSALVAFAQGDYDIARSRCRSISPHETPRQVLTQRIPDYLQLSKCSFNLFYLIVGFPAVIPLCKFTCILVLIPFFCL